MERLDVRAYVQACAQEPAEYATLSLPATAQLLGVTTTAVRDLIRENRIAGIRITAGDEWRRTLVKVPSLVSYLATQAKTGEQRIAQATAILEATAADRKSLSYGEIMGHMGMTWRSPPDRSRIGDILGEVSELSLRRDGFMLSALAVLKSTGRPNEVFFGLARRLEILDEDGDEGEFLEEQRDLIWRHYSKSEPKQRR